MHSKPALVLLWLTRHRGEQPPPSPPGRQHSCWPTCTAYPHPYPPMSIITHMQPRPFSFTFMAPSTKAATAVAHTHRGLSQGHTDHWQAAASLPASTQNAGAQQCAPVKMNGVPCWVWKTYFESASTSLKNAANQGSRWFWPGTFMARSTRSWMFTGPAGSGGWWEGGVTHTHMQGREGVKGRSHTWRGVAAWVGGSHT